MDIPKTRTLFARLCDTPDRLKQCFQEPVAPCYRAPHEDDGNLFKALRQEFAEDLWYLDTPAHGQSENSPSTLVQPLLSERSVSYFSGHHVSQPCLPGHLFIEMAAQAGICLLTHGRNVPQGVTTVRPVLRKLISLEFPKHFLRAEDLGSCAWFVTQTSQTPFSGSVRATLLRITSDDATILMNVALNAVLLDQNGRPIRLN